MSSLVKLNNCIAVYLVSSVFLFSSILSLPGTNTSVPFLTSELISWKQPRSSSVCTEIISTFKYQLNWKKISVNHTFIFPVGCSLVWTLGPFNSSVLCLRTWPLGGRLCQREPLLAKQQQNILNRLPSSAAGFDLWWCFSTGSLLQLVIWSKVLAHSQHYIRLCFMISKICNLIPVFFFFSPETWWCCTFPLFCVSCMTLLSPFLALLLSFFFFSQWWCHPVSISLPLFFPPPHLSLLSSHLFDCPNPLLSFLPESRAALLTSAGDRSSRVSCMWTKGFQKAIFNFLNSGQKEVQWVVKTKQIQWNTQSHGHLGIICWRLLWWYRAFIPVWSAQMADCTELLIMKLCSCHLKIQH